MGKVFFVQCITGDHNESHRQNGWYTYIYSSEHKAQNDIKKKSKCEITFYFIAS